MRFNFTGWLFFLFMVMAGTFPALGQPLTFFHLDKSNGLSDNTITALTMDKSGILWLGTPAHLNSYDGRTVSEYTTDDSGKSIGILSMVCDKNNCIWMLLNNKTVAMLDEKRRLHKIIIREGGKEIRPDYLLPHTTARGVLFIKGKHLYTPDAGNPELMRRLSWDEDQRIQRGFERINLWDDDKIVFSGDNYFCLLDIRTLKLTAATSVPSILAAAKLSDSTALITTHDNNKLCLLNIFTGKILESYGDLKDQFGDKMKDMTRSIYHLRGMDYIITSAYAGVYVFNASQKKLARYNHDPLDPKSVSANNTSYIFSDSSGYFFITSNTAGLNYFNLNLSMAGYKPAFRGEEHHEIFDGYINCVSQSGNGNIWLGGQSSLIEWNPENNTSHFVPYPDANGNPLRGNEEVRSLYFDKTGKMWIGLNRHGVMVMDKNRKIIKRFEKGSEPGPLQSNFINQIQQAPDGIIWVATARGIVRIEPEKLKIISQSAMPELKKLENKNCNYIWFGKEDRVWIATDSGVASIHLKNNSFKFFDQQQGVQNISIKSITEDDFGNLYFATPSGVDIFKNGVVIRHITKNDGSQIGQCLGVVYDGKGKIWIGNNNEISAYDPLTGHLNIYDHNTGFSETGFRQNAFYLSGSGMLYWGSDKGLNYFQPGKINLNTLPIHLVIQKISTSARDYWPDGNKRVLIPYGENTLNFYFNAIDISGSQSFIYQYKLQGAENDWQKVNSPQSIKYSKLPPGNYSFFVKTSRDGVHWTNAEIAMLAIKKPWWISEFFIVSCFLILLDVLGYRYFKRTQRKLLLREKLETEKAINYFATTMYEHEEVEDILWQVAKDCISRLGFEDCVIYLKDSEKNVLIQKAAWGPKTTQDNRIINPLAIPLGQGIVGQVAITGSPEIIADTSLDSRYIIDDKRRYSEICVPINYNGRVLGIIDSEHSRKNFFNHRHLSVLTTIASLCANKIVKLQAEKEKREAQLASLNHSRRVAEEQLKSLRLQMNPHFLFNSLNSIQQIILSGDERAATLYLSKFSRLLRLVLSHSDRDKVNLREELETLSLYVELEALRFNESFYFNIECDEDIDPEEIYLPTLLIQPFVENAIWHGLLHKTGDRYLHIRFRENHEKNIICEIEDNGIGRAASIKMKRNKDFESKGISIARERIDMYNRKYMRQSEVKIHDLKNNKDEAVGTRVEILLPLIN